MIVLRGYMWQPPTPAVDRLFWYDLRDDGRLAYFEDHFGLLENGLAKKPSFWAYKLSLFLLNGGKLLGVAKLRPQVLALEVRNHGKTFDIVWNDDLTSYKLNMAWTGPPAAVLNWRGQQVGSSSRGAVRMYMPQRSLLYVVPLHFSPVQ